MYANSWRWMVSMDRPASWYFWLQAVAVMCVTWKHQAKLLLGVKMLVRGRTALCLVGLVVLPSVGVVWVCAVLVVVC